MECDVKEDSSEHALQRCAVAEVYGCEEDAIAPPSIGREAAKAAKMPLSAPSPASRHTQAAVAASKGMAGQRPIPPTMGQT